MKILFWIFIGFIVYCYFGYPLAIAFLARVRPRPVRKAPFEPTVSIVLSVWNEEDVIRQKIENLLKLDYPVDKVEILIGSDGSSDRTEEIIRPYAGGRVQFFGFEQRRGKMLVINDLAARARHDILVFTDARQAFAPDAVRQLAENFSDPDIGCVSGELIFRTLSASGGGTTRGVNLYWEYEKFIRGRESRVHSMLGATGAIYAVRRHLFTPLPADIVLDDLYVPFHVIRKGFRAVFDPRARAFDDAAAAAREEHRRKVRTLFGNYQLFALMPGMLNPFQSPVAVQLFSHKVLRLLAPFLMIAVFILNIFLLDSMALRMVFYLQILYYLAALIGGLARNQKYGMLKVISKCCAAPYVSCLLNFSALAGFWRFITGGQQVKWEKAREKT